MYKCNGSMASRGAPVGRRVLYVHNARHQLREFLASCLLHAGVPLPLLPHEVAVKGLRPEWPQDLPAFFRPLQQLAEACWVHTPEDRWVLPAQRDGVLSTLGIVIS